MATIRTARTIQALPAAPAVSAFAAPAADATPPGSRAFARTAGAIALPTIVVLIGLAALDARTANRRTVEV